MAYSYKGAISFGLVYIPITLHAAVRSNNIGFNMLDKATMQRIKYKKMIGEREVTSEDIVKGFEYDEGKYVIFEESDFDKIKSKKDKSITISQFVDIHQIDPIFFEKPYYVIPTGAERAFVVLLKAMQEENKVGIAKTVLGNKETLVAIRAKNNEMLLNTLFFEEEIQKNPMKDMHESINDQELTLAKTIIESMNADFDPIQYKDEYKQKVINAIEQKIAGKEIVSPQETAAGNIADLMEALQASLDMMKKSSSTEKRTKLKKKQDVMLPKLKENPSIHA